MHALFLNYYTNILIIVDKYTKKNRKYQCENEYDNILKLLKRGKHELESLNRQVIVDRLYGTNNTIHKLPDFHPNQ